jgi:hypothetical protein
MLTAARIDQLQFEYKLFWIRNNDDENIPSSLLVVVNSDASPHFQFHMITGRTAAACPFNLH